MKVFRLFGLTSLLVCTIACTGSSTKEGKAGSTPITVASASQRSAALLGDMARDASETAKATIDLESVENTAELLEDFVNLFVGSGESEDEAPTTTEPNGEESNGNEGEGEGDEDWGEEDGDENEGREDFEDEEEEFSAEEFADEIREVITEELLTEGNLETIDGDTATFLIRGENICGKEETVTYDQNGNETWSEEPDTECIESIDEAQLRIEAKLLGEDGIELKVFVGAERSQVVVVTSLPNSLTVDFHLAGLKDAIEVLDGGDSDDDDVPTTSTSTENPDSDGPGDTPEDEEWEEEEPEDEGFETNIKSAQGVISLAITINGDQDATASISITKAVQIVLEDEEKTVTLSVGESNPLFNLHAQPLLGLVALGFDLNNVDLSGPMSLLAEDDATGELFAHLSGIQFEVDLDDTAESVTFTNVGLGDSQSTLKHNETTIVALDLNENAGRSFNFQLNDVGDEIHLTLTPEFMLSAAFNFQAVAQMFDDVPDFLMDETISIRASGESGATLTAYNNEEDCGGPQISSPSEEAPSDDEECTHQAGLKVIEGTLEIDSTKADNPLIANSNQCLTGDGEPRANESHEILRELSVISCE